MKNFLILVCIVFIIPKPNIQAADFCKAAKDSVAKQFAKGEMAFYLSSINEFLPTYFITISNSHYERQKINYVEKDTTNKVKVIPKAYKNEVKRNEMNYLPADAFLNKKQSLSVNPNDTSSVFKACFNNQFKSKLDSAFKCDFFNNVDSILDTYDKIGKGYSNIEFPGGADALQNFMNSHITLPKDIKTSDKEKDVRIYYSFIIDEKGVASNYKLIKSNCKACEDIVLQGIKQLPAFKPAVEAGKKIRVVYILPYVQQLN
ncbi:MAG: hypothetical protein KDD21_10670 [Bacteroidetes bacterium]|nr:hypothetical protein [Bacteroidota bacterium]